MSYGRKWREGQPENGVGEDFHSRHRVLVRMAVFKYEVFKSSKEKNLFSRPLFFLSKHNINVKGDKHFLLYFTGFTVLNTLSISQ